MLYQRFQQMFHHNSYFCMIERHFMRWFDDPSIHLWKNILIKFAQNILIETIWYFVAYLLSVNADVIRKSLSHLCWKHPSLSMQVTMGSVQQFGIWYTLKCSLCLVLLILRYWVSAGAEKWSHGTNYAKVVAVKLSNASMYTSAASSLGPPKDQGIRVRVIQSQCHTLMLFLKHKRPWIVHYTTISQWPQIPWIEKFATSWHLCIRPWSCWSI